MTLAVSGYLCLHICIDRIELVVEGRKLLSGMYRGRFQRIGQALRRTRSAVWTIALTSALSVTAGLLMAHCGNRYALETRDRIVGTAQRGSATLRQFGSGNRIAAAALDATGNAAAGSITMIAGYFPPAAYGIAAYRGWVGGIVGVDDEHRSRLGTAREAFYYLTTLLLQLVPYSLASAAGVNIGIAAFAREERTGYSGRRMPHLRIPYEAIRDSGLIWIISLPLFAFASLFEFVMRYRVQWSFSTRDHSRLQIRPVMSHFLPRSCTLCRQDQRRKRRSTFQCPGCRRSSAPPLDITSGGLPLRSPLSSDSLSEPPAYAEG